MPDYIDTREPGWRRTGPGEDRWPNALARIEYFEDGREIGWVREAPVPPLPTEPGYYVDQDGCAWRLDADGEWDDTFGNPLTNVTDAQPRKPLTRLVQADELIRLILALPSWNDGIPLSEIERLATKFGVSS